MRSQTRRPRSRAAELGARRPRGRSAAAYVALLALAGCQGLIPKPDKPPEGMEADFGGRLGGGNVAVEAEFTGQDTPTLTVVNDGAEAVHVFLDDDELGVVEAEGSAEFDVPSGRHTVGASPETALGPTARREQFTVESGYRYALRLLRE